MGMSVLLVVLSVAIAVVTVSEAQSPPACASKLTSCVDYLNSTSPPATCCNPLREAVTNEHDCLCNLYETPGLLISFGINVTQAIALPGHCGIPADLSACRASGPASPSGHTPTPGGPENNGNRVGGIALAGIWSFMIFWVSIMHY